MAISFSAKTVFLPSDKSKEFTDDEKAQILKVMQDAYNGSATSTIISIRMVQRSMLLSLLKLNFLLHRKIGIHLHSVHQETC
jgi:hypothetical protein